MIYPIKKIRADFPILKRSINKSPLIYLDNASTSQKPNVVIDAQANYYRNNCAASQRAIHTLSTISTNLIENTRYCIKKFINASATEEIIFVKSTTEAINLISNSWGENFIQYGDNIIISEMEHHANIIPWQILSKKLNIKLHYIPLLSNGTLDLSKLSKYLNYRTRLLSIIHISNVLGTTNPIKEITTLVRKKSNAIILIDGAQSIAHQKIDVQKLDCDFYVFSGHKIYAPSGTGVMYGKKKLLKKMPPWIVGGGIIQKVSLNEEAIFVDSPWKFEAGSPNVSGIIALKHAIDYINKIGFCKIIQYEDKLMKYIIKKLKTIKNITLYGPESKKSVISFNLKKHHAYDIGILLDQHGIAIRTGHHCALPIMNYFKVSSMCRASLAMYTSTEEIDKFVQKLTQIDHLLNK